MGDGISSDSSSSTIIQSIVEDIVCKQCNYDKRYSYKYLLQVSTFISNDDLECNRIEY